MQVLALDDNTLLSLPDSLGDLAKLERLSVAGNTITELPHSIGQLNKLVELNVARNKLAALPASLGSCSKLENIDATDNYLKVSKLYCGAACMPDPLTLRMPALSVDARALVQHLIMT